jgi:hypothetical protein
MRFLKILIVILFPVLSLAQNVNRMPFSIDSALHEQAVGIRFYAHKYFFPIKINGVEAGKGELTYYADSARSELLKVYTKHSFAEKNEYSILFGLNNKLVKSEYWENNATDDSVINYFVRYYSDSKLVFPIPGKPDHAYSIGLLNQYREYLDVFIPIGRRRR